MNPVLNRILSLNSLQPDRIEQGFVGQGFVAPHLSLDVASILKLHL